MEDMVWELVSTGIHEKEARKMVMETFAVQTGQGPKRKHALPDSYQENPPPLSDQSDSEDEMELYRTARAGTEAGLAEYLRKQSQAISTDDEGASTRSSAVSSRPSLAIGAGGWVQHISNKAKKAQPKPKKPPRAPTIASTKSAPPPSTTQSDEPDARPPAKKAPKKSTNVTHRNFLHAKTAPPSEESMSQSRGVGRPRKSPDKPVPPYLEDDSEYGTEDEGMGCGPYAEEEEQARVPNMPAQERGDRFIRGTCNDPVENIPDFGFTPDMYGSGCKESEYAKTFHSYAEVFMGMLDLNFLLSLLVDNTNATAARFFAGGRTLDKDSIDEPAASEIHGLKWRPVLFDEMFLFFVYCMHMCIVQLAREHEYWSTKAYSMIPAMNWGRFGLSRARFYQLKKKICLNITRPEDLETCGDRKGKTRDKIHCVAPLVKILLRTIVLFVERGLRWSVDESIIPYTGLFCPVRTYMPNKPHKYGIKLWCVNCPDTGGIFMDSRSMKALGTCSQMK
jgi:Transposase IS4